MTDGCRCLRLDQQFLDLILKFLDLRLQLRALVRCDRTRDHLPGHTTRSGQCCRGVEETVLVIGLSRIYGVVGKATIEWTWKADSLAGHNGMDLESR